MDDNHKVLFEKIEAKQKDWENQIQNLREKASHFDYETRTNFENQITNLNLKLKDLENRTLQVKNLSKNIEKELSEKLIYSWIELFTKIDNAMSKLKK